MAASTGRPKEERRRPRGLLALFGALAALAVLALPTGILLLWDPSGKVIGGDQILPVVTSAVSFVQDFTIVGLWLLLMYGLVPVALAVGLLRHSKTAWRLTVILGATVLFWIAAEVVLFYAPLGFTPLYPLVGGIGLAILGLCLVPSVRSYASV